MPSKFVVARSPRLWPGEVQYLSLDFKDQSFRWIAPGEAADRPGGVDYHRFEDQAEAVSWCLVFRDRQDEIVANGGDDAAFWVREIA